MEKANPIFLLMKDLLSEIEKNPEKLNEKDRDILENIFQSLKKPLNISEHVSWAVEWVVEKWNNLEEKAKGIAPYEVIRSGQNIVLNDGATEMLKLISGTGGTAYNNANAKIYVGTSATSENASQTGVVASGASKAYANIDSGYPKVEGRTVTYRATFSEGSANFEWNEVALANGTGSGSVAMNRKVSPMGTKNGGAWTMQLTISLLSS